MHGVRPCFGTKGRVLLQQFFGWHHPSESLEAFEESSAYCSLGFNVSYICIMDERLRCIPLFNTLSPTDLEAASGHFSIRLYTKGSCILKPGSSGEQLFFLFSGLVYCHSQEEKIYWYEFEGQPFADLDSFFFPQPCAAYIRCAEDSVVVAINKSDLEELVAQHHVWAIWYSRFLNEIVQRLQFYYKSLLVNDATQRYHELIALHPEILQRIPLGHIASYLGISQVSLSRIRAGKQKKDSRRF